MMLLSGNQNNFWRGGATVTDIVKGGLPLCQRTGFHPIQVSKLSCEYRCASVAEILGGVGLSSNKGDLLQGHAAYI
jgi:hypothetical protein